MTKGAFSAIIPIRHGIIREFCCANQPIPEKGDGAVMPELKNVTHVSGLKQTVRAVKRGEAKRVYVARDADPMMLETLRTLCEERGVPMEEGHSMRDLGNAAGIAVGAAAIAVIGE